MDIFKQQIQRKLIANVIIDKCSQSEHIIFRSAWCTQERVLRFTTPFFRKLFSVEESNTGKWKTGDCVMYEINNSVDSFVVNCLLAINDTLTDKNTLNELLKALNINLNPGASTLILKSWNLTAELCDSNKLFDAFDYLIQKEIPYFEQKIKDEMNFEKKALPILEEGTVESVTLNKYERNKKARAACLAAHGTKCIVCGIDFGKTYGAEFDGKIEVHHIVPISEIGKKYTVDPVKDLVPVCPNCHMALHSKKDGVYTIQELKKMKNNH